MIISPDLLQFLGSLGAILAVAGLVRWMGLGGRPKLADPSQAREAANEAVDGYVPEEIAIDAQGQGAIMQDSAGRILILKPHGNKFAGRLLNQDAAADVAGDVLTVISGERRYGSVKLSLDQPMAWAGRINALESSVDA